MKITLLEISNFKRIKALRLIPCENGLTTIGGKNAAGKTSVLDAITFGFGGKKYMPTNWKREGAVGDTLLRIETDNGLIIERKGKNMDLTVTDKDGKRGGQSLLDAFISELAIDLPKFHNASSSDKAEMLLDALKIGDQLAEIDKKIEAAYGKRTTTGQLRDSKKKHADEMPFYEDAPDAPVSIKELIDRQQSILARNGANAKMRETFNRYSDELENINAKYAELREREKFVRIQIESNKDIPQDESTAELEKQIADFEKINDHVRANAERAKAEADADLLSDEYDVLTTEIEKLRSERLAFLQNAKFPLHGISVDKDAKGKPCLTYNGKAWDCMSGAQQLIVDTAIASMINPECRFVNLDKLEQLDLDTLGEFDKWLQERDLQCIATRVSTGDECSVVITDGEAEGGEDVTIDLARKPAEKADPKPLSEEDV